VSTLVEIEAAIAKLSAADFRELLRRLNDRDADEWDRQIDEDAKAGRLDVLWQQAKQEIAEGKAISLDEFLGHP